MPTKKTEPAKRVGFFANLPRSVVAKINRRVNEKTPQWKVIVNAINATEPKRKKK